MTERLDKFLANQNIGSRKEVSLMVRKGLVRVNGETSKKADIKIDPENDEILVNGERVGYIKNVYIMMNKPKGVLSASEDRREETVVDILPDEMKRRGLFPAGRLDRNTTGLLIVTDDGEMAHRMLAPKSHVWKIYRAELEKPATAEDVKAFEKGISQGGNDFLPAELKITENPQVVYVRIREGKFHQIKRMFEARENAVVELKRLTMGGLRLDENIEEGNCRYLTKEEVDIIFSKEIKLSEL
ncbi:MAG: pseudouridine synthase [Clostridia bacterium]|nr:pseudouridine synthase [Clostridia bacterium]